MPGGGNPAASETAWEEEVEGGNDVGWVVGGAVNELTRGGGRDL